MIRLLAAIALAGSLLLAPAPASAQEDEPAPSAEVPTGDIVPRPNSGTEPTDAGDRGGALQLLLLALLVGVIGLGAWRLSVHVRRGDRRPTPPPA